MQNRKLRELRKGLYASVHPTGTWGYNNAGLLVDGEASLLIDTLFDRRSTAEMLAEMRRACGAAAEIDIVVNTHANGDHCWGNELVEGARIIGSEACAREMAALPPAKMAALMRAARVVAGMGPIGSGLRLVLNAVGLKKAAAFLEAAPFIHEIFGDFDFRGTRVVLPGETFAGELAIEVGTRRVELIEVGPAHTRGDVIVHLPHARTVFTGDILFSGSHPIVWAGPVANWIAACERILALDVEVVVPGHGPLCDTGAVRRTLEYLRYLSAEARRCYDDGMSAWEAARAIGLEAFAGWGEGERVVANVEALYRELRGERGGEDAVATFAAMARWIRAERAGR